jgi:hypothetical protein
MQTETPNGVVGTANQPKESVVVGQKAVQGKHGRIIVWADNIHSRINMKTILQIAVLTFLVIASSSRCYAMRFIKAVFTAREAQALGVQIRSEIVGTNQFGVWLEFSPHGALERFHHGELDISSGRRELVGATLLPLQHTNDKVVLYFSGDADNIKMSTLTVIVSGASGPEPDGYSFIIRNFVKLPSKRD